jgi:4-carboxymuconolactone decarboxylase
MLHFPRFGVPALHFLAAIGTEAQLPAKVREVAILTTGACFNARYEIYAHEIMADVAGLSAGQVASLAIGVRPADLTPEEEIAHGVATALSRGQILPASTYTRAVALLGRDGLAELTFLIGGYCLISMVLNCFDVPVPDAELLSPIPSEGISHAT